MVPNLKNYESKRSMKFMSFILRPHVAKVPLSLMSMKSKGASSPNEWSSDTFFLIQSQTKNVIDRREAGQILAYVRAFWSVPNPTWGFGKGLWRTGASSLGTSTSKSTRATRSLQDHFSCTKGQGDPFPQITELGPSSLVEPNYTAAALCF